MCRTQPAGRSPDGEPASPPPSDFWGIAEPHARDAAERLCRRFARHRIEPSSIAQEVLLGLHETGEDLPALAADRLTRLINTIARNRVIDRIRKLLARPKYRSLDSGGRHSQALIDGLAANTSSPLSKLIRDENRILVANALAQLPQLERDVIALREIDQLKFVEIAVVLEISPRQAGLAHIRAIKALQAALKHDRS